jgi:sigma-B regulation protein RsbU (phosphoserine phosphatase)
MKHVHSSDKPKTFSLELTVKNQLIEINRVNETFNAFAEKCGLDDSIRRKVNLVFDEILNNIISYAFQDDEEHRISIVVEYRVDKLTLNISDDGIPFNLLEAAKPQTDLSLEEREIGGLGIHLVRTVMDEHDYQRKGKRNHITLIKNIE